MPCFSGEGNTGSLWPLAQGASILSVLHSCLSLSIILQGTIPCCSSCGFPIQGHQIPTGSWCSILFDETMHASGWEPECTVCLQPWGCHPQGKHIPKDCKFQQQQAPGDSVADDPEQPDDGDVHTRLTRITQENQAIRVQLSQLTELVHQLLPQPGQASPQPAGDQGALALASMETAQTASTSSAALSLPPPLWPQSKDWEGTPGPLQLLLPSHAGQHPLQPQSSPLPAVPGPAPGQVSATEASPCQSWHFLASTGVPMSPATEGLSLAQVPASFWGKIQCSE